jgi:hypothetical protein
MATLAPEVRAHRRDLSELVRLAQNDLRVAFRGFDTADAARDGLTVLLPRLMSVYGEAAASLAADWYDDQREAAEARGRFSPILADLPDRGRTDSLARWAVGPLYQADPDFATTLAKVGGGLQRIIANADRQTIQATSVADPGARGWARAGVGECDFCQMLIGRGAVYTEATADFESHDRCGCVAVPAF